MAMHWVQVLQSVWSISATLLPLPLATAMHRW
jgi:hypothetical protein